MKTYKYIIVDINKHLGLLTLNRPEENNSLNIETSKEIYKALKELEMNSSIKVILIQGNPKIFSPGADIKELKNLNIEISKATGTSVSFDYTVDENLIGGLKMQIGSLMVDTSIRNKLKKYEQIMLEA